MSTASPSPEFSRPFDRRQITAGKVELTANEAERAALAERFSLVSVDSLKATLSLEDDGEIVNVQGRLRAKIVQSCAVSGDDLASSIDEELTLRFVPLRDAEAEEVELEEDELDEIPYEGTAFDLGEAVAQSLALAIDPYAIGPNAETVRDEHDLTEKAPSGPLQEALSKLKKD